MQLGMHAKMEKYKLYHRLYTKNLMQQTACYLQYMQYTSLKS